MILSILWAEVTTGRLAWLKSAGRATLRGLSAFYWFVLVRPLRVCIYYGYSVSAVVVAWCVTTCSLSRYFRFLPLCVLSHNVHLAKGGYS